MRFLISIFFLLSTSLVVCAQDDYTGDLYVNETTGYAFLLGECKSHMADFGNGFNWLSPKKIIFEDQIGTCYRAYSYTFMTVEHGRNDVLAKRTYGPLSSDLQVEIGEKKDDYTYIGEVTVRRNETVMQVLSSSIAGAYTDKESGEVLLLSGSLQAPRVR